MGSQGRPVIKPAKKSASTTANKRQYMMQGKPVADIDEVMNRVEGRGQGMKGDEPTVKPTSRAGGGDYGIDVRQTDTYKDRAKDLKDVAYTDNYKRDDPDRYDSGFTPRVGEKYYRHQELPHNQPRMYRLADKVVDKESADYADKVTNRDEYAKRKSTSDALTKIRGDKPVNTTREGSDPIDMKEMKKKQKNPKDYYIKKAKQDAEFDEIFGDTEDSETLARREAIKRELRKKRRETGSSQGRSRF